MVRIKLDDKTYEYDVRSLTKAFFMDVDLAVEELTLDSVEDEDYVLIINTFKHKIELAIINKEHKIDASECIVDELEDLLYIEDELEYKARYKNILKRGLYRLLSGVLNKKLPWGTLTGIRPSKIVLELLEQGKDDLYIREYMKKTYLTTDAKIDLALEIAHKEIEILDEVDYKNGYSLYIGIPFCPTRCSYCSFTSYPLDKFEHMVEDYIYALFKEMEYASTMIKNKTLTTVYIGGGTPTTLTAKQLERVIYKIKTLWDFSTVKEFTVEAGRPDSITRDKLEVLKKCGVTRISINPQTMNQRTLDLIGRKHSVSSITDVYNMAKELCLDNINMDLILGLPGEDIEDIRFTLKQIEKLNPQNLTVHTLAIKRAAYLNIYKDRYEDMLPKHITDMVEETLEFAKKHNYLPYYMYRQKNMTDNLENIGYAKVGYECIYNILMMEERQTILALGAGAVCKFVDYEENRIERLDNVKSLIDYVTRIDDMIEKKMKFSSSKGAYFDGIFR